MSKTKVENDLLYKIALTRIPQVGAVTARSLVAYCGGVAEVFQASFDELVKIPGIGQRIAKNVCDAQEAFEAAERELDFVRHHDVRVLFFLDDDYPIRLRALHDAPLLLYYKGTAELNKQRILSIVGTRLPTPYGIGICEEIIEALAPFNPLIVSGLAYGIDYTAHRKALQKGLETVAVLGHGLGRIYPAQHHAIAMEMIEQGGLLTEYASDLGPEKEHFPMRNRIVAGLCDALIVVETAARGGSMITAQQATNYDREVFAVPGRIKDQSSAGCNLLIKRQMAHLLIEPLDIAKMLGWEEPNESARASQPQLFEMLTADEQKVVDAIREHEEIEIDALSHCTQIPTNRLSAMLLELEFKGIVRSLPGKLYILS
ncbi:MAG: DNA processing protein DprA [Saprospiraceae bacterium]|nr:MAG: DNA processing protein DprA [Saprospiraceae bacterium]